MPKASPTALTPDKPLEAVIAACQAGDRDAFAVLYERYHREIYLYLLSVLRSPHAAEDVAQDVFVKLFTQIGSYRQQSPFNHWLFRMARNAAIDKMRRDKVRRAAPLDDQPEEGRSPHERLAGPGPTPEEDAEKGHQAELVREAVMGLPEPFREIVVMREWQDLPYEEIAGRLDIQEGTVKSRLFRARQLLAEKLKKVL